MRDALDRESQILAREAPRAWFTRDAVAEAVRVLHPSGVLALLDVFPFEQFDALLGELPVTVTDRVERALNVRWNRQVAKRAIALYAEGWGAQTPLADRAAQEQTRVEVHSRMVIEMERQLVTQGITSPLDRYAR